MVSRFRPEPGNCRHILAYRRAVIPREILFPAASSLIGTQYEVTLLKTFEPPSPSHLSDLNFRTKEGNDSKLGFVLLENCVSELATPQGFLIGDMSTCRTGNLNPKSKSIDVLSFHRRETCLSVMPSFNRCLVRPRFIVGSSCCSWPLDRLLRIFALSTTIVGVQSQSSSS